MAYKGDVGHHIPGVDILLDVEIATRHSIARVESLVHGHTERHTPFGDVDGNRHIGGFADAEIVVDFGTEEQEILLPAVVHRSGELIGAFVEEGVETRDAGVAAVDSAQGDNGLVVVVGNPCILFDNLRHCGDPFGGGEGGIVDSGEMECLALGWLHQ